MARKNNKRVRNHQDLICHYVPDSGLAAERHPGKQWIGKYRCPRAITWQMKHNMIKHLEHEAENEYWLSRPYMTAEQEVGHAAERRAQSWAKIKEVGFSNFPKHKLATDHLNHLRITKTWTS